MPCLRHSSREICIKSITNCEGHASWSGGVMSYDQWVLIWLHFNEKFIKNFSNKFIIFSACRIWKEICSRFKFDFWIFSVFFRSCLEYFIPIFRISTKKSSFKNIGLIFVLHDYKYLYSLNCPLTSLWPKFIEL